VQKKSKEKNDERLGRGRRNTFLCRASLSLYFSSTIFRRTSLSKRLGQAILGNYQDFRDEPPGPFFYVIKDGSNQNVKTRERMDAKSKPVLTFAVN